MSSYISYVHSPYFSSIVRLLIIVLLALIARRMVAGFVAKLSRPAQSQTRAAQIREQQTRGAADLILKVATWLIVLVAVLTALPELGIDILPAVTVTGLICLVVALGTQSLVRDMVAGFNIALEDQFAVGDTVQVGECTGRVEETTLRRTVLRDSRGALVSVANGELRQVANLSRDWSQAFLDVALSLAASQENALQALEAACAELRSDQAWAPALVDGPRILGIQALQLEGSTVRVQVRTAPNRQDEVVRELRRRIQLEFQKQHVPLNLERAVEFSTGRQSRSAVSLKSPEDL